MITFKKQKNVALYKMRSFQIKFRKEFREYFYEFLLFMESPRSIWLKIAILGGNAYLVFEWLRTMIYYPDAQKFLFSPRLTLAIDKYHNTDEDCTFLPQEELNLKKLMTGSHFEYY